MLSKAKENGMSDVLMDYFFKLLMLLGVLVLGNGFIRPDTF